MAAESYKRLFGVDAKVKAIHAGLECGLFLDKYPALDMISFGPTLQGVHSPDERMLIPTVQKFWDHLLDILKHIPARIISLHKGRCIERMRSHKMDMLRFFYPFRSDASCFPYISLYGQEGKDTLTFRIVSYNVENLFDSRHDTLKNDYEFLPDATRHWNYSKYRKKLDNIARVIIATGGWTPPALVALCEVENDSVMRDLTRYSVLREQTTAM